jgi:hypothetical protein
MSCMFPGYILPEGRRDVPKVVFFIDFDSIVEDEACGPRSARREIEIIKTTYDISLDSQISLLPRGFSPPPVGGPKADEVAVPLEQRNRKGIELSALGSTFS